MKLQGKVVVVTGSTRGIGKAIAKACAEQGAKVVVSSRKDSAVEATVDAFRQQGHEVSGVVADVTNPGDLHRLLEHAVSLWNRVDVWVNNAGISGGFRPLHTLSDEEIAAIVDTNLTATLWASRLVIPQLIEQGGGVLINMTGKGGRGEASPYMTTYGATKAAVTSLSKSLAKEYEDEPVSIHSASPGMVKTDMFDDVKATPETQETIEGLPYVFEAIGTDLEEVGPFFADIAAQQPGKDTGKSYSLLGGWRLARGIMQLMYYRATGRLKA